MITPQVRAVLERLEARDAHERQTGVAREQRLRQVTREVGEFLQTLVLATRPKRILEVGTSGGYSTVWIASAARHIGAVVTTVEIDPAKVRTAASTLTEAGLSDLVSVVEDDAFAFLHEHTAPFDFVFLDAEKEDYLGFLEVIVPLLTVGGTLVADNLISHAQDLAEFREAVLSDPRLSGLVVPIGRGELVAVRLT